MEGKPSLTIEGNPLLMRNTFKDIPYYRNKSLTNNTEFMEIPYNRRASLTIEGDPLREISKQTVEENPLLYSKGFPPIVRDLTT